MRDRSDEGDMVAGELDDCMVRVDGFVLVKSEENFRVFYGKRDWKNERNI